MTQSLRPWISDSLPNFIAADHPQFKKFIEAYYDYLEHQDSDGELPNSGGIVNKITDYRDVDLTHETFFGFFENEFIPFARRSTSIERNIFLKKIRDVYLAKGTQRSYELFFRLLFQEEIDIFESRDNILELSEGNFVGFPTATFQVTGFVDQLSDLDFTLARIEQNIDDDIEREVLANSLSGTLVGGTTNNPIISVQLDREIGTFSDAPVIIQEATYLIRDTIDSSVFIEVKPQLAIRTINIQDGGAGYLSGDEITVRSNNSNRNYTVFVTSVETGTVDGVYVRDRGEHYKVGDRIIFQTENIGQGQGGEARITAVDRHGRITEIDGTDVRTGLNNTGYLADTFESAKVPVNIGGVYREIPTASFVLAARTENEQMGRGAIVTPFSDSIGSIQTLDIQERGYFSDSEDIEIEVPMNLVLESRSEFVRGETVSFQYFDPTDPAFEADSEVLELTWTYDPESYVAPTDPEVSAIDIPVGFNFEDDSDLFIWERVFVDLFDLSDVNAQTFGNKFQEALDSEGFVRFESETVSIISNSEREFRVQIDSKDISTLDYFHFNRLNGPRIKGRLDNIPGLSFSWRIVPINPKQGAEEVLGTWRNSGYYGIVENISTNGVSVTVRPTAIRPFPADSDLTELSRPRFTILRLASANAVTGDITIREGLAAANIISNFNTAVLKADIAATAAASAKTFVSEDGFLNSLSGGVLQDGLFYSNYTYVVQSDLQMSDWRVPVRTTIHPAGTQLYGEYNLNVDISAGEATDNVDFVGITSKFSFDSANDVFDPNDNISPLNAANAYYDANAYNIYLRSAPEGIVFSADNYINDALRVTQLESGNSWWDYEPVGLVRNENILDELDSDVADSEIRAFLYYDRVYSVDSEIPENERVYDSDPNGLYVFDSGSYRLFDSDMGDSDSDGSENPVQRFRLTASKRRLTLVDSDVRVQNIDSEYVRSLFRRRVTSQRQEDVDSDGSGNQFIGGGEVFYSIWDGTKQDLYKNGDRNRHFQGPYPTFVPSGRRYMTPEIVLPYPWDVAAGLVSEADALLLTEWARNDGAWYDMSDRGDIDLNTLLTATASGGQPLNINPNWWNMIPNPRKIWVPTLGIFTQSPLTNMFGMFMNVNSVSSNIGSWDVSSVTQMTSMFADSNVNVDIGSWNPSSVTTMASMFLNARRFNQDIGGWNVSSVENMERMFENAIAFNNNGQDLNDWNTADVRSMFGMFNGASNFNQDIGDWDVRNVTTTASMFEEATLFNQNLDDWELDSVIDTSRMFFGATAFNNGN